MAKSKEAEEQTPGEKPEEKPEESLDEKTLDELLREAGLEEEPAGEAGEDGDEAKSEEETEEGKEDDKPPVALDLNDPNVQTQVRSLFDSWVKEQQASAATSASAKEISELVERGDTDELGKRFAAEFKRNADRNEISREVLTEFLGGYYTRILSLPEFQNLTDVEKVRLDPRKFATDVDYMFELQSFVEEKRLEAKAEGLAETRLKDKITALKKGAVPDRVAAAARLSTPSGTPAGGGKPDSEKSGSELIAEGWEEILNEHYKPE